MIVDNRPGGDTIIGTEAAARSAPDGYTILLVGSTHVAVPLLHRNIPYDAIKDFAAVATISSGEELLVLHPSVPANTLQEFIALAKSKPGQLNYASAGIGITNHLASELFNIMAGIKVQHIPYKGGGPALAAVLGGQVEMFMNNPLTLISYVKSGKTKAIAISGDARFPTLPQVPTFTEAGLPGFNVRFYYAVVAPVATPKQVIGKLSAEIGRILSVPDLRQKLSSGGMDPFISSPEQFEALRRADMENYARVIKTANIKLDQ